MPESLKENDIFDLLIQLKSKSPEVRETVLLALDRLYWHISRKNLLNLLPLLQNSDEDVRIAAADAIGFLMQAHPLTDIISELIQLRASSDLNIRSEIDCFLSFNGQDVMESPED